MHPVGPVCLRLPEESKLTDHRILVQSQMVIASRLIPSRTAPSSVSVVTQTIVWTYACHRARFSAPFILLILFFSYPLYSTSSLSFPFKKNISDLIQWMSSDGANCYYISRDSRHPRPLSRLQSAQSPLPEPRTTWSPSSSPRSPSASVAEPSESKDPLTKRP